MHKISYFIKTLSIKIVSSTNVSVKDEIYFSNNGQIMYMLDKYLY